MAVAIAGVAAVAAVGGVAVQSDAARRAQNQQRDAAAAGAAAADPASGLRPFFQDQLRGNWDRLSAVNPNDILTDPSFQFIQGQGMGAIKNDASAKGLLRSGTMLEDMSKFNTGLASQYVDMQFSRNQELLRNLGNFSGLNIGSPGTAGNILNTSGNNAAMLGYGNTNDTLQQIGGIINRVGMGGVGTPVNDAPAGSGTDAFAGP